MSPVVVYRVGSYTVICGRCFVIEEYRILNVLVPKDCTNF